MICKQDWKYDEEMNGEWQRVRLNRRDLLVRGSVVGGLAVAAPFLLPTAAQAQFKQPSADKQKEVGREAAKQVLKQYKEVTDSRATVFRNIGSRLVNALPDADRNWDFNFRVLDSKEVNAFALPGGPMFLFTGLYKLFESEDAVAAVTGHEMTHVRKEHWAKAYKKAQTRGLFGAAISILTKNNGIANTITGLADAAIGQKFSRGEEDEADKLGLEDLVAANYNPQGMIDLFEGLQKAGGREGKTLAFLSDHPLTSDRIKNTKERIAGMGNRNFPPLKKLAK